MKTFYTIIEIITSPFTFLYRTKASKNANKQINTFLVFFLSLLITAVLLLIFYFTRLFK